MNNSSVFCTELENDHDVIWDKDQERLLIYRDGNEIPKVKIDSISDILAIRDLLNAAYPMEVLQVDRVCRVQGKGAVRSL